MSHPQTKRRATFLRDAMSQDTSCLHGTRGPVIPVTAGAAARPPLYGHSMRSESSAALRSINALRSIGRYLPSASANQ